jgi:sugar phosphate permease
MSTGTSMRKWQIRIFAACFIAYTAAYICRVNISVALPGIQESLGLSSTRAGLIGTSFFWIYAIGQLVNGYIGDQVSGRIFIFIGLITSVLINVLFGFSTSLIFMVLLWGANGIFQSMLWGPIVRILANWFPGRKNASVAFGMSFSMIIGYLIAWGISGMIMERLGWRWAFWFPAGIVTVLACVWYVMVRNKPSDIGMPAVHEEEPVEAAETADLPGDHGKAGSMAFLKLISGTNLLFVAFAGITQGIIKDSISLWSPTLIMNTQNLSLKSTLAVVLIIPVLNFLGILFAGWLNRLLKYKEKITIMLLMIGSALASLGLVFFIETNTVLTIILISCASAFIFGANPAMTTIIPLSYREHRRVSSVAGFIDFSIYVGSGLAGAFTGFIADHYSWTNVFTMWFLVSLLGALSMGICVFRESRASTAGTVSGQGQNFNE